MTEATLAEGTCTRCGDPVVLERVTEDSEFWAWTAPKTAQHPMAIECWATDGRPLGRLHHVAGQEQLVRWPA